MPEQVTVSIFAVWGKTESWLFHLRGEFTQLSVLAWDMRESLLVLSDVSGSGRGEVS